MDSHAHEPKRNKLELPRACTGRWGPDPMQPASVTIVDTRDEPLRGAMMVVGFPTHGLVGSVAASYLLHALDMQPIAYMISEEFPPRS